MEPGKVETRGHGAADQRPIAGAAGRLPVMRRHDQLRRMAAQYVRPQQIVLCRSSFNGRAGQDQGLPA